MEARPGSRDVAMKVRSRSSAVDKIKTHVSSALKDVLLDKSKSSAAEGKRWDVIENNIKSMSDVSEQILHNQVMQEAPSPQKTHTSPPCEQPPWLRPRLQNQSMELEREKIQLERLKIQKELRLMKDSDMNNEVGIADDDSCGVNDLNKCN